MTSRRRIASTLAAAAALVGVAAAGYWAGTKVVTPPTLPAADHPTQTYTAQVGSVGRSVKVPVTASWETTRTLLAGADGMVTTVRHAPGALATAGEVIATIELRPVVVASGAIPMFRTLRKGLSGPDVKQFQQLLRAGHFLTRPADGHFTQATIDATKRWQHSIGASADGVVDPGAILFVDGLPARLVVIPGVGTRTSMGSDFVHVIAAHPTFVAIVSASTRSELQTGMAIAIAGPSSATWSGSLGTLTATEDGRYRATIGGSLCDDACDSIAIAGETALSGAIDVIPTTVGVVVPISALTGQPSGGAAVTLADGTERAVRVLSMADGFAVVDGLAAGSAILLPAPPGP